MLFLKKDLSLAFSRVADKQMVFGSISMFGLSFGIVMVASLSGLILGVKVISTTILFPSTCDLWYFW